MTETGDFGPAYERPGWAFTEEVTEDGEMVFRDSAGRRLRAIAFTEPELRLLRQALSQMPRDGNVQALLDKLRDDV